MEQLKPQQTTVYFPNLDGFRTISFLIVFLGHCFILFDFGSVTPITKYINKIVGRPSIGVHFFFVLSGFLISYLLLIEKATYKKINIGAFYMRRILRIWPVYFMVILVSLILSLLNKPFYYLHDINWLQIGLFLTNFNLSSTGISSLPITVLWSVAVEEQFYLVLPLLITLFSKRIFYFFPIFILLTFLFRINNVENNMVSEFHTFSVCSSLFIGCVLAYFVVHHNLSKIFERINKYFIKIIYLLFFIFHIYRDKLFDIAIGNIWLNFIYALIFAFVIMEQNYSKHSFYKMQNFKLLSKLGKYTYGLYAYHMIFISLFLVLIPKVINPKANYFIYFSLWILALVLSFAFARLSYVFIEKPFLSLKKKFSR